MMNKSYFLFLLLFFQNIYSYSQNPVLIIQNDLEQERSDYPWINQHTIVQGDAWSGSSFSRTDSINFYGIGWKGVVPKSFQHKNIRITFSGYVRLIGEKGKASLVVSILKNDSTVFWENRPIRPRVKEQNVWTSLQDNIVLPGNLTGPDYTLLIYLWNEDATVICDMDALSIQFVVEKLPSYLIPSDTVSYEVTNDVMEVYSGAYFKMDYDKFSGQFRILSPNNRVLLSSFSFYSAWTDKQGKGGGILENVRHTFFLRDESLSEEGKIFTFESRSDIADTKLNLLFSTTEPLLIFNSETTFHQSVLLTRLSLSASIGPDLLEVYRNSSFIDTLRFQDEYWLGNGGFQAYSDSAGFILYHAGEISSLQLSSLTPRVTVNIDWEMDHPLLHWPLLKKSENIKQNHSSGRMNKGSVLKGKFTIQGIRESRPVPRLLKYPSGHSAALIWTEHADYSDMNIQRAVNFGSDKIVNSLNAEAGFVKNKIPVTKSVFYANPDQVMNSVKAGFVNTEIANVKGTPGFRDFLIDLQRQGQEICLHTPDQFTTSRSLLEEAIIEMKKDFNSESWIDHGYDNAGKSNRENLVCDGLDEESDLGAIDLWKEYGLKYFWNCFYEDTTIYTPYSFNSFLTLPYYGLGDRFPIPEYWRHPTRSDNIIHWRTTGTLDPPDGSMWNYYLSENRLKDLVQSRGTSVLHVYPARADSTNGFYELKDGHFRIQETFETALQRQAQLRDMGLLNLVTVKSYLDYRIGLEKLDIRFLTNGKVRVENKGDFDLKGLSFALSSGRIGVRGKSIQSRMENGDTFFWFDLNKGEVVLFDILP